MNTEGEAVIKIASGNNHFVFLTHSGRLYTCGCGESGQLGRLAEMFATRDSRNRNGFGELCWDTNLWSCFEHWGTSVELSHALGNICGVVSGCDGSD